MCEIRWLRLSTWSMTIWVSVQRNNRYYDLKVKSESTDNHGGGCLRGSAHLCRFFCSATSTCSHDDRQPYCRLLCAKPGSRWPGVGCELTTFRTCYVAVDDTSKLFTRVQQVKHILSTYASTLIIRRSQVRDGATAEAADALRNELYHQSGQRL